MNKQVSKLFYAIRNSLPNKLDNNGNYQFIINESILNGYCNSKKCSNNLEKINAGCLYLFDAFFKDSSVFESVAKGNINIVEYIIIWLSHMLIPIKNDNNDSIEFFYKTYIDNDKYKNSINGVTVYKDYKDLIDKRDLINMDIKSIYKFYDAFNTLCLMYVEFDEDSPDCKKYSDKAKEFVKNYKKLKGDSSITENSLYNKILSTLLTDYNNLKDKCSDSSSFPSIETTDNSMQSFGQISEDTSSSSSIANKLLIVLSIFGAMAFFLGISYKVNNKEFKKYFHYIYANFNKKIVCFLTLYISIRYLDFGNDLKNNK
ncbi:hypothetical protein YYC_02381 [Plasmodium yoelii 17X]|uniref:Uncharacterized protein n=1 Tax=Plasmodium yoelii 17X TaxID=1323249 RepID=V7PNR9_PLAYE|nr:hypothetical protein YYC_02381 [Plasmodium yoelii 17X]